MGKNAQIEDMWGKMPVLLALSRLGTLDRAAEHLNVNRTTVSRRLHILEESIGGSLFTRADGNFSLTPLGRELLAVAEAAEASLAQMEAVLPTSERDIGGPLKITIAPHVAALVAPALIEIASSTPSLKLEICSTYELKHVEAREADIALRVLRSDPEFPLVGKRVKKLAGAIYSSVSPSTENPVHIIRRGEVEIPKAYRLWNSGSVVVHTDEIIAKRELIAAGGVGRLPIFLGDADPRLKRLNGLLPYAGWGLWLLTHEAFRSSPRLDYGIKAITAHFNRMPNL